MTDAPAPAVVLHIPHASTYIPVDVRASLLLDDADLADELLRLTDHYTDELFAGTVSGATEVIYPVSRLVVDPERFENDDEEPAAAHGMGVIYTRGSRGLILREKPSRVTHMGLLERFYRPHHRRLTDAVAAQLARSGQRLVIDCHSFPREPLPTEKSAERSDICIGADDMHTPAALLEAAVTCFRAEGYVVQVNEPFAGALVPSSYYRRDTRVSALMVEIGRWLYMDEGGGLKSAAFAKHKAALGRCMRSIANWKLMPSRSEIGHT